MIYFIFKKILKPNTYLGYEDYFKLSVYKMLWTELR